MKDDRGPNIPSKELKGSMLSGCHAGENQLASARGFEGAMRELEGRFPIRAEKKERRRESPFRVYRGGSSLEGTASIAKRVEMGETAA